MFLSIVTKTSNFIFCQRNQLTVLFPAESGLLNGLALVSGLDEKILRSSGQALVQEQFHFKVAARLILASSRAAMASARLTLGKSSRNLLRLRSCSK